MIALYQFPISHYCEKIRRAPDTCVPILDHDDRVIQGSDSIITYLDETFAEQSLTPATEQLKNEALDWEQYVDREIGKV